MITVLVVEIGWAAHQLQVERWRARCSPAPATFCAPWWWPTGYSGAVAMLRWYSLLKETFEIHTPQYYETFWWQPTGRGWVGLLHGGLRAHLNHLFVILRQYHCSIDEYLLTKYCRVERRHLFLQKMKIWWNTNFHWEGVLLYKALQKIHPKRRLRVSQ